jgi:hypothetical protein
MSDDSFKGYSVRAYEPAIDAIDMSFCKMSHQMLTN